MVREATPYEHLLALKTAEEYRRRGYEVQLQVPLDFLPSFTADLLARKGGETKVIEVTSRSSLAANPRIIELARVIDSKLGWSFDLVLAGEPEKLDSPEGARPFEGENIAWRTEQARKALEARMPEAAFLLAWSAAEAVIRELLTEEGVSSASITSPDHVLDQGVFLGILSRNEYNALNRMRKYRNAIAHGFTMDDFSPKLVTELLETVQRVTASASESSDDIPHEGEDRPLGSESGEVEPTQNPTEPLNTNLPVLLFRINRLFRSDMSDEELYEATRQAWVLGEKREKAEYAVPVYRQITREVYRIENWYPVLMANGKTRWAFTGHRVEDGAIRNSLVGKDISALTRWGNRSPTIYVNCD